jgi:hypothetical protein
MKNNYMRNPLAMEVFNEELCSLLKRRIKDSVFRRDELSIAFHYAGEVALEESEAILRKVTAVHKRVLAAADRARARFVPSPSIWQNPSTDSNPISFNRTSRGLWRT